MKDALRRLIHAYLDGELEPEEATELIAGLREDRAAAGELRAHERLLELAEALPHPEPSAQFLAQTLARIERRAPVPSLERGLLQRLRGRTVELSAAQLSLGATLAVALLAGVWLLRGALATRPPAEGLVAVQFTLAAPQAHRVQVAGDFNGWNAAGTPLVRGADGTYRAQLLLPRGKYQYQFVVDGERWVPDPRAAELVDDGFGGRNALLDL